MNKIVIILIILLGLTAASVYLFKNSQIKNLDEASVSTPTLTPTASVKLSATPTNFEQKPSNNFNVEYIIVRDSKKISLYDNSQEKLTSAEAIKKYECDKLISGGFWREDTGKSLGLLISDGKVINGSNNSDFYNGYFFISNDQKSDITESEINLSTTRVGLQSGPILFMDNLPLKIYSDNDENSRRIVIAKTFKNEIVFLVFYYKPSQLIGPKLKDLPKLLEDLNNNTNLKIESALNLDGGAHSTFVSGEINITEISRVGSFFCIKP